MLRICEEVIGEWIEAFAQSMQPHENQDFCYFDHKVWMLLLRVDKEITPIKELDSSHLNMITKVSGIVSSISKTNTRAVKVHVKCQSCQYELKLISRGGLTSNIIPR